MNVIVKDSGFTTDDWSFGFDARDELSPDTVGLDLASDTDPDSLNGALGDVQMVRIDFPSFADGRGFTIARQLRLLGYQGRLRAKGHVISDQYTMARRVGFDEVEISDELAARQPEADWLSRANWQAHNYQARMRVKSA